MARSSTLAWLIAAVFGCLCSVQGADAVAFVSFAPLASLRGGGGLHGCPLGRCCVMHAVVPLAR